MIIFALLNNTNYMKAILTLVISLFSCLSIFAQTATEYFNVGNLIKYCGTKFSLVWSAHPQENYFVQEYLPEGESLEHYNQMFTVSVIFWDRTPLEAVQAKITELEERKKADPITQYLVVENNGEYILEFLVGDSSNGMMYLVELDIHHYRQMKINGRNASVLSFYSCRAYGDDIIPFIQSISEKRNYWYEGMSKLKINPKFPKK